LIFGPWRARGKRSCEAGACPCHHAGIRSAPESRPRASRRAHLTAEVLAIPVAHERRHGEATIEPFAGETLAALQKLGIATAIWTNNDRVVADYVLARFNLLPHLDLVVTRDDVTGLKPDPDGLRVVRQRWPRASRIVVVGDSWVDGVAAQTGGVRSSTIGRRAEPERRGVVVAARSRRSAIWRPLA
jgi:beta-phosphoglucomutase-like phosphatase (HAD superfamily)